MKVSSTLFAISFALSAAIPALCLEHETNGQYLDNFIRQMTPEEKVGQLLMLGILNDKMTPGLEAKIQKVHPGFLILFRKNIKTPLQTARLIYDSQLTSYKYSRAQMLVAVDQEGGDVVRIPTWPPLPTALALGRSHDLIHSFEIGKNIGEILKNLGIHINLAPVLDLSDPEKNSFIQTRSFGDNPIAVADVAEEFSRGLELGGVLSTAKHFPGLGDLINDSHKEVAENPVSRDEFLQKYLVPYEKLIQKNSLSCIMMTHLIYPNLDPSRRPATFSPILISFLKERLHFKGLVITDDIEMAGAKYYKDPATRAVEAFLAGNDVLMAAWNERSQVAAARGLLMAYKNGIISEERINSSLKKILSAKLRLGLLSLPKKINSDIIFSSLHSGSLKIAIDAIFDKILDQEFARPVNFSKISSVGRVLVFASDYNFYKNFSTSFGGKTSFIQIGRGFRFNDYIKKISSARLIVFDVRGPKTSSDLARLPKELRAKTLVVNSRFMGSVKNEKDFLSVLQISMKHPDLAKRIGEWLGPKNSLREPAHIN